VRAFYQKSWIRQIAARRLAITSALFIACISSIGSFAQIGPPEIISISPTSGPEGARLEITGENLAGATTVLFGATPASFKQISHRKIIALVPHKVAKSMIIVRTRQGSSSSPFPFTVYNDPRIPKEVSYKAGYVNAIPRRSDFSSARLWGIAIAATRVHGHEAAHLDAALLPREW
jgi:IPT/TIG domain